MNAALGKMMVLAGLALIAAGLLVSRVPWLGRLPGDIAIKREHFSFYFPLTTGLILSAVVSLILRIFK